MMKKKQHWHHQPQSLLACWNERKRSFCNIFSFLFFHFFFAFFSLFYGLLIRMPKCIELPESIMKHNTTFKNAIIFFYKKIQRRYNVTNSLSIPLLSKVVVRMKIKTMKHIDAPPFLLAHRLVPWTVFFFLCLYFCDLRVNVKHPVLLSSHSKVHDVDDFWIIPRSSHFLVHISYTIFLC